MIDKFKEVCAKSELRQTDVIAGLVESWLQDEGYKTPPRKSAMDEELDASATVIQMSKAMMAQSMQQATQIAEMTHQFNHLAQQMAYRPIQGATQQIHNLDQRKEEADEDLKRTSALVRTNTDIIDQQTKRLATLRDSFVKLQKEGAQAIPQSAGPPPEKKERYIPRK
jgi:septal ring factor EnvC (AmiA/AmiB activator)